MSQIVDSTLMSADDVAALIDSLPAEKKPQDGEQLAKELVRRKKLTAYQAQQIYAGKSRSLVLGEYVILDKLGQGGMGLVLKAGHRRMKRLVALKVLSPKVTKTPEALRRFQREVEAAARLTHPNIVIAHDAGEAGGTHFLVMEYVDGSDLSTLVKKQGPLPLDQALDCILQAARGLQYAHERGVVHRDIKPANLLLECGALSPLLEAVDDVPTRSIDGSQAEPRPPSSRSAPAKSGDKAPHSKTSAPLPAWNLPPGSPPPAVAPFDAVKAKEHQAAWAKYLGVEVESENSLGMRFVLIPPGEFDMGSTEAEVAKLLEQAKSTSQPSGYIERLPAEAEWEYSCRAGTTTTWYSGDDETGLKEIAWYSPNSGGKTHPVCEKAPNAWGLYDMHGNVWEWCQDWWAVDYYGASPLDDPTGASAGSYRVFRGGSWFLDAGYCRPASRPRAGPGYRLDYVGFRVASSSVDASSK